MTLLRTALIWDINLTCQAPVPKSEPTDNAQPNGSRLSCGRGTRWRKAVEPQTKRLDGEATQLLPTCERPTASSACSAARGDLLSSSKRDRSRYPWCCPLNA